MLQPATVPLSPAAQAREDREPIPASIPRHAGTGWPQIRHADDPTQMSYFRRPSSFGDGIESTFMLDRRADRLVMAGLVTTPALFDQAVVALYPQELPVDWDAVMDDPTVKRELHRIRDAALTQMGADRRAALGTELHELRDRLDREGPGALPFLGPDMWAALQAWTRIAALFTWHGSEQFVVCDRWRTAGTYDALWSPRVTMCPPESWGLPPVEPGQRVIVDLKSGAWVLKYGEVGRTIQLTQYPNGVPYVHVGDEDASGVHEDLPYDSGGDNGRREWPDGIAPRTDLALIPHVPLESPQDAGLLWVNLELGAELSEVAYRVHECRRLVGELILPAELPADPDGERVGRDRLVLLARAEAEQMTGPPPETPEEAEMLDHDCAVIEDGRPCPRRERGEACADCDAFEASLTAPEPEFVEPPGILAPLHRARDAVFDRLASDRLLAEIRAARLPMTLHAIYRAQGERWPSEAHRAAADARWAELTTPTGVQS